MSSSPRLNDVPAIVGESVQRADLLLASGAPLREVLLPLVAAAEQVSGHGATSSILVIDQHGLLRDAASPNLPIDYLSAIDRLRPEPDVGTCAAAAATGRIVVTEDFLADSKWAELKHLPLALGYVGAWSMPVKDHAGRVIGTFGTYYRERRVPTGLELASVARLATAAARAMGRVVGSNGSAGMAAQV